VLHKSITPWKPFLVKKTECHTMNNAGTRKL